MKCSECKFSFLATYGNPQKPHYKTECRRFPPHLGYERLYEHKPIAYPIVDSEKHFCGEFKPKANEDKPKEKSIEPNTTEVKRGRGRPRKVI